jgi:hypothetical protein
VTDRYRRDRLVSALPSGVREEGERELHRSRVERVAFDAGDAGLVRAREHVVEVGDDEGEEPVAHGGSMPPSSRGGDGSTHRSFSTLVPTVWPSRALHRARRGSREREHLGVEALHGVDVVGHDPDVERPLRERERGGHAASSR